MFCPSAVRVRNLHEKRAKEPMVVKQVLGPVSAQERDYWEISQVVLTSPPVNVQLLTVDISDIISKS